MATKFAINPETGEATLKQLRQSVEELNALVVNCDQTLELVSSLDKTLGLNVVCTSLINNAKEALQQTIPVLEESLVPIEEFVKNMNAVSEAIGSSTAGNLDVG